MLMASCMLTENKKLFTHNGFLFKFYNGRRLFLSIYELLMWYVGI